VFRICLRDFTPVCYKYLMFKIRHLVFKIAYFQVIWDLFLLLL